MNNKIKFHENEIGIIEDEKQKAILCLWELQDGFHVGDILINKVGKKGIVNSLDIRQGYSDNIDVEPTYKTIIFLYKKDGTAGKSPRNYYSHEGWKKHVV